LLHPRLQADAREVFMTLPRSQRTVRATVHAFNVLGCLTLVAATGCAARTSQFHDFATAGVAYVKASEAVLDEAGSATIRADTAVMITARPNTPEAERGARIRESNTLLKQRMVVLRDIRRHGRQLQRYFEALASIADSKAPESAAKAAESAFEGLAGLSAAIKNSSLKPVVPTVTTLTVGAFKARILEDELRRRADAIAAELALQEAAFAVIGDQLKTDLGVQLNTIETQQIITPYRSAADLPKDWGATREQFLKTLTASASADAAGQAARALREAFEAVVANRFDQMAFASLLADITEMLTIAEQISR